MGTKQKQTERTWVWMYVRDPRRLARLMVIEDISQRQLAIAAGWKSHSYIARILRGETRTLRTAPALLIAQTLRVPVEELFVTRTSTNPARLVKTNSTKAA